MELGDALDFGRDDRYVCDQLLKSIQTRILKSYNTWGDVNLVGLLAYIGGRLNEDVDIIKGEFLWLI
jgi:hypothetical protein